MKQHTAPGLTHLTTEEMVRINGGEDDITTQSWFGLIISAVISLIDTGVRVRVEDSGRR